MKQLITAQVLVVPLAGGSVYAAQHLRDDTIEVSLEGWTSPPSHCTWRIKIDMRGAFSSVSWEDVVWRSTWCIHDFIPVAINQSRKRMHNSCLLAASKSSPHLPNHAAEQRSVLPGP